MDDLYDKNYESNKENWGKNVTELVNVTTENEELNAMFMSWKEMFRAGPRGTLYFYYFITKMVMLGLNLLFFLVILVNELRFCCCGRKINILKQELPCYRGVRPFFLFIPLFHPLTFDH